LDKGEFTNAQYISLGDNKGIATALNVGCKLAIAEKAAWILTMDQDSDFGMDGMEHFLREANQYPEQETVGVFCPRHVNESWKQENVRLQQFKEEQDVWTSGSLINVDAYKKVGDFRDDFFIDHVDVEFCIRLSEHKYKVLTVCRAELHHYLGDGVICTNFFGVKKYMPDHSPLRRYYITRNGLHCGDLHPQMKQRMRRNIFKQIKKVLLYDTHKDKWKKLRYMIKGIYHYRKGIFGKLKQ
jgi:rhamnosyltransferase